MAFMKFTLNFIPVKYAHSFTEPRFPSCQTDYEFKENLNPQKPNCAAIVVFTSVYAVNANEMFFFSSYFFSPDFWCCLETLPAWFVVLN